MPFKRSKTAQERSFPCRAPHTMGSALGLLNGEIYSTCTLLYAYVTYVNTIMENTMKQTKRKAKWEKVLTLTEIKHLRENTDGTLKSVKETFRRQQLMRERSEFSEPCWDCKMIERKLSGGE